MDPLEVYLLNVGQADTSVIKTPEDNIIVIDAYRPKKLRSLLAHLRPDRVIDHLIITHPHLKEQVHPTKNGTKKLEDYSYGSREPFWWLCPEDDCGYEWEAPIQRRTRHGCPACAGKTVTDRNRVTITHPHLIKEVHPTKNGDKKLEDYSYGSHEPFWWLCPKDDCGHEWEAQICNC